MWCGPAGSSDPSPRHSRLRKESAKNGYVSRSCGFVGYKPPEAIPLAQGGTPLAMVAPPPTSEQRCHRPGALRLTARLGIQSRIGVESATGVEMPRLPASGAPPLLGLGRVVRR